MYYYVVLENKTYNITYNIQRKNAILGKSLCFLKKIREIVKLQNRAIPYIFQFFLSNYSTFLFTPNEANLIQAIKHLTLIDLDEV